MKGIGLWQNFEERFELIETKLPALETVRRATLNKIIPLRIILFP